MNEAKENALYYYDNGKQIRRHYWTVKKTRTNGQKEVWK